MFGFRAAVVKPYLLSHYGCFQTTGNAFLDYVWSLDIKKRKVLLGICLNIHWFLHEESNINVIKVSINVIFDFLNTTNSSH